MLLVREALQERPHKRLTATRGRRASCNPGVVKHHELGLKIPDFAELPSGLLAPVDVAAQPAPPRLPPGIDQALRPKPVFIQRQSPAPIDYMLSWIDEAQLDLAVTTLPDLIEAIRLLPFERTFRAVARLLRELTVVATDARAQLALVDRVYAQLPYVRERIREIVTREPSHLPFAEPVLVPLLRLVIEHAEGGDSDMPDDELEMIFGSPRLPVVRFSDS